MDAKQLEGKLIRQTPSPLPLTPKDDPLTTEQWSVLSAIADTVIPSLTPLQGNRLLHHPLPTDVYSAVRDRLTRVINIENGSELVDRYLAEKATAQQEFKDGVKRMLAWYLPDHARTQLQFVLKALSTRSGALVLTGYATPLDCLPVQTREGILQSWATSRLPMFRLLCRSLNQLVRLLWIRTSPTLGRLLSYPRTPIHDTPPGTVFPFQFLQIPPSSTAEPEVIETEIVIVGSGCGGAVAAKTLAEAGMKVMVVDKSHYWPPKHLPMSELEAAHHLFADGGLIQSDDSSIGVVAGSAWGGGGTINWSASLQTQGFVRREWAEKFGLRYFMSADFQADLDAVCERMGVGTAAVKHNHANHVLLEGARKLGWSAKAVPQNTGGEAHNCGYCTLGCGSCGKKGPTETWLPDAAKAGAVFVEGFDVQEVVFDDSVSGGERRAVGVKGLWTSRDSNGGVADSDRTSRPVVINARRVIISAGTISSPLILHRSRLRNPQIGRNLHLHPVSFVGAIWDDDICPWEGPILTSVVSEFENLDSEGHGAKLEATTMIPGLFLPAFSGRNGAYFKEFAAKMRRMTGYISLARERYTGRVYPDPKDGRCRIQYTPSRFDRAHILEGVVRLAEIAYVEGAREIFVAISGLDPFVRPVGDEEAKVKVTAIKAPSVNDAPFQQWIARLRSTGLPLIDTAFASAHQMGTCRMATTPAEGVVDPNGRVWGTTGLYVCDASVFPSASGVNPMITNMAIARGVARGIVDEVSIEKVSRATKAKL